ncbi:MAG: peptidoglycan-binding domain-containing protein [Vicingaceae bacterium]
MKTASIKKINPLWLVLSGVATIGAIYGIYYLITKENSDSGFSSSSDTTKSGFCKYTGFPLRHGSCGNEVKDLQRYLNIKLLPPRVQLKVDGKMGNKTIAALKHFERISSVSQAQFTKFKAQLNPFTKSRI